MAAPPSRPPAPPPPPPRLARASPRSLRLALVGDVHGAWSPSDAAALAALAPDAALFVGDFGNECVATVAAVASVEQEGGVPIAAVLGNHDAWFCLTDRGVARRTRGGGGGGGPDAARRGATPAVTAQRAALGEADVGWRWRGVVPARDGAPPLAVAGGRPFSNGGPSLDACAAFYEAEYGVASFDAAAAKTAAALAGGAAWLAAHPRAADGALVLLAHNGPTGLGAAPSSPCGADFLAGGGDWGDPDLAAALAAAPAPPALVAFGHMHRSLRGTARPRTAAAIDPASGAAMINAAAWPRRAALPEVRTDGVVVARAATAHHCVLVEVTGGVTTRADDVWVEVESGAKAGAAPRARVRSVGGLVRTEAARGAQGEVLRSVYDAWAGEWAPPVATRVAAGWRHPDEEVVT